MYIRTATCIINMMLIYECARISFVTCIYTTGRWHQVWQHGGVGPAGRQTYDVRPDLRDLCRRLENVGRVAADGGEKRGVCGYVSRGRSRITM